MHIPSSPLLFPCCPNPPLALLFPSCPFFCCPPLLFPSCPNPPLALAHSLLPTAHSLLFRFPHPFTSHCPFASTANSLPTADSLLFRIPLQTSFVPSQSNHLLCSTIFVRLPSALSAPIPKCQSARPVPIPLLLPLACVSCVCVCEWSCFVLGCVRACACVRASVCARACAGVCCVGVCMCVLARVGVRVRASEWRWGVQAMIPVYSLEWLLLLNLFSLPRKVG